MGSQIRQSPLALLVLLLVAGGACGRSSPEQGGGRSDEDQATSVHQWLTVSDRPADLRQARQLADRQRSAEIADILSQPERVWWDDRTQKLLREHRARVIPRLAALVENGPMEDRLLAASVLVRLGDRRGRDALIRALQDSSEEERVRALHVIDSLHEFGDDQPHLDFLLADPRAAELLLRRLDDPEPLVRKAAVQACGLLNVPGHVEKFRALLHQSGYPERGRIAYWLAAHGDPQDVVEDITRFFHGGMGEDDVYWTVSALKEMVERGDASVDAKVMDLVHDYYARDDLDRGKLDSAVGWQLTSLMAEHATPESAAWLRSQLSKLTTPHQKGDILRALARIDAEGWRELVFESLSDKDLKPSAAAVLGEKLAGTADADAVERLRASLQESDSQAAIAAACKALVRIGGIPARETVARWAGRADPWTRMDLTWDLGGWTLDSVKPTVVASGLLTEAEYDAAVRRLEQDGRDEEGEYGHDLLALLYRAERLLAFDVETGELPCRHDQLLEDFAAISGGVFRPEAVSQEWRDRQGEEDFDADYTLRFVHGGRLYAVHLRNLGDWYDVERLVLALNMALERAGRRERFVPLHSDGQVAQFVFGTPAAVAILARKLQLPVDDDLGRALRGGKEFEQRVLEQLRKSGELGGAVE